MTLAAVPDPQHHDWTFGEIMAAFLEHCEEKKLEPATRRCYAYMSRRFLVPELGHRIANDLRPQDFDALATQMSEAGYVPSTIKKAVTCAGAALKLAERNEWVTRNAARLAETPKREKVERDIPTPDQLAKFLRAAAVHDIDMHDYARVMAGTGMRPGEACGLMRSDLDHTGCLTIQRAVDVCEGRARIKTTKTGRVRRILVDAGTAAIIYSRPGPYVFGGEEPGRTDLMSKRFKRVAGRAGTSFTPRALRHFHATQLLASGKVNAKQLAERLGHANPLMTLNVYAQYVPALDQVAADVIGDLFNPDAAS